ncbi:unnamed protein product [Moneuplotes crassus]|uniref:Uncharacterized protein n=1 Tax=Euplotes crassus TaxID=5936 RepID=A0AAD2CYL5_EUPCR|nr:unnamed protein product [Moneuplotes crassus]
MTYYLQPKSQHYDSLDVESHKTMTMPGHSHLRNSMECADIDGAAPAKIPGYTGSKSYRKLTKNGSMPNFGPTKTEIDSQWQKSFKESELFNPSSYKYDFNKISFENPHGMVPQTTDARILPSQAYYSSRSTKRMIKKPQKSKKDLDDTFARLEEDLALKNEETLKEDAAKFYLQTPIEQKPQISQDRYQNMSPPGPAGVQPQNQPSHKEPSKEVALSHSKASIPSYPNLDAQSIGAMYSEQAYKPKLDQGYEEGRDFYENLHLRRSKGLAPATKIASEHFEVESHIFNRNNNEYGKYVNPATMVNTNRHEIHKSRRQYNPLTNEASNF